MNNNPNQPRIYDAVLGGEVPPPVNGVVLGGIGGVKSLLRNSVAEIRCIGITQAANYGKEGLDLIIEALNDSSGQVRSLAYNLLEEKVEEPFLKGSRIKIRQVLSNFDTLQLFTTLKDWVIQDFSPRYTLAEPGNIGYKLKTIEQFNSLLQSSQVSDLQALVIKMHREENRKIIDITEDHKYFPGLKALSIFHGKHSTIINNVSMILKAYPNLNLVDFTGGERIIFDNIQHKNLKTLIISSGFILNFDKLELPGLEYLDLKCRNSGNIDIQPDINYLKHICSGNCLPNLRYLGLRGGEDYNKIASFVVGSGILNRLIVLDLSDGDLGDKGAESLFNCPITNRLHTLNLSKNRLSPDMVNKLSQLKSRVIAESQKSYRYKPSRYNLSRE